MKPGPAALCEGEAWHRRNRPTVNEFSYRVSMVWIDPDRPEDLTDLHPLWSSSHVAPVRFRRSDYGIESSGSLAGEIRRLTSDMSATGPVRMLTQLRRWGWLFNPITLYIVWPTDGGEPAAAVAEVTNTPWHERHQYPFALEATGPAEWNTSFDKAMHVSPFLGMSYRYALTVTADETALGVRIDVCDAAADPILETELRLIKQQPSRPTLTRALVGDPLAAHRVSTGIHWQAARLAAKRVPFVPHPKRERNVEPEESTR